MTSADHDMPTMMKSDEDGTSLNNVAKVDECCRRRRLMSTGEGVAEDKDISHDEMSLNNDEKVIERRLGSFFSTPQEKEEEDHCLRVVCDITESHDDVNNESSISAPEQDDTRRCCLRVQNDRCCP